MIVHHTWAGEPQRAQFPGGQFKTDEFNNLCIYENTRCVKVFAVNTWQYVELEDG
jgi:hypothetical protein